MEQEEVNLVEVNLIDVIISAKFADTKSEAKRLIKQKAIKINKEVIDFEKQKEYYIELPCILQKGKFNFIRLI